MAATLPWRPSSRLVGVLTDGRLGLSAHPPLLDIPEVAVLDVRERAGCRALELLVHEQQRVGREAEVVRLVLVQLAVERTVRFGALGLPARRAAGFDGLV